MRSQDVGCRGVASSCAPCWLTPGMQGMRVSARKASWWWWRRRRWWWWQRRQSPTCAQTFRRSCGKAQKPRSHEHLAKTPGEQERGAPLTQANRRGLTGCSLRMEGRGGAAGSLSRVAEPLTERGSAAKAATLRRISFSLPRSGISDTLPSRTSGTARDTREGSEGHTRPSCCGAGEKGALGPGLGFRWPRRAAPDPPTLPRNASGRGPR